MGIAAVDFQTDYSLASGAHSQNNAPTAVHLFLSEEELGARYQLYRGSGGFFAPTINTSASGTKVQVEGQPRNNLALVVSHICNIFGLTKEELASACHVQTRKTLYNWINGEATPRKSALRRIFDLHTAASAWKSNGFPPSKEDLHSPQVDGKTLFDALCDEPINSELVLFIGSRINTFSAPLEPIIDPFA